MASGGVNGLARVLPVAALVLAVSAGPAAAVLLVFADMAKVKCASGYCELSGAC